MPIDPKYSAHIPEPSAATDSTSGGRIEVGAYRSTLIGARSLKAGAEARFPGLVSSDALENSFSASSAERGQVSLRGLIFEFMKMVAQWAPLAVQPSLSLHPTLGEASGSLTATGLPPGAFSAALEPRRLNHEAASTTRGAAMVVSVPSDRLPRPPDLLSEDQTVDDMFEILGRYAVPEGKPPLQIAKDIVGDDKSISSEEFRRAIVGNPAVSVVHAVNYAACGVKDEEDPQRSVQLCSDESKIMKQGFGGEVTLREPTEEQAQGIVVGLLAHYRAMEAIETVLKPFAVVLTVDAFDEKKIAGVTLFDGGRLHVPIVCLASSLAPENVPRFVSHESWHASMKKAFRSYVLKLALGWDVRRWIGELLRANGKDSLDHGAIELLTELLSSAFSTRNFTDSPYETDNDNLALRTLIGDPSDGMAMEQAVEAGAQELAKAYSQGDKQAMAALEKPLTAILNALAETPALDAKYKAAMGGTALVTLALCAGIGYLKFRRGKSAPQPDLERGERFKGRSREHQD
ncbi:MAG: hypothetical protein ABW032_11645 [Burkholderiaceae bacterium]